MFPLEDKLIVSQDQKLADDEYAFEVLQSVAKALRHDMKQSIEILEEGHGKADSRIYNCHFVLPTLVSIG